MFTTCLYLFTACPVEMLPTLQLKIGILPILMGSVQVWSVMFMAGLFAFKCFRLVLKACLEVESWYLTITGCQAFQDSNSTGQDGKCNRQVVAIHGRLVK